MEDLKIIVIETIELDLEKLKKKELLLIEYLETKEEINNNYIDYILENY